MTKVAIIDYGRGNLRSVANAIEYIGVDAKVTNDMKVIDDATHIILPGVGSFGDAISALEKRGLIDTLNQQVIIKGKPFLGICVGMQVLARTGWEHGVHSGLGWLNAEVSPLRAVVPKQKIPHMGWNTVELKRSHPVFSNFIKDDLTFYFVHSFAITSLGLSEVLGTSNYGLDFVSVIAWDNIVATQFHPEKSQDSGLDLLSGFVEWSP
jgi:glutamine amidotransferase